MKQWHGQQDECPVDADKLIDATYRNGSTQRAYAGDFRWRWMQDSYDVVAYSVVRQRKHSQDILDKLEEARKNKQSFLEQTGVDMKALAENGFDANNGAPQLRPVPEMSEERRKLFAGIEQMFDK